MEKLRRGASLAKFVRLFEILLSSNRFGGADGRRDLLEELGEFFGVRVELFG